MSWNQSVELNKLIQATLDSLPKNTFDKISRCYRIRDKIAYRFFHGKISLSRARQLLKRLGFNRGQY